MSREAGAITRAAAMCGGIPTSKRTSDSPEYGSCQRNSTTCCPGANVPLSFAPLPGTASMPTSVMPCCEVNAVNFGGSGTTRSFGTQAVLPKL